MTTEYRAKTFRSGNSLALRLPKGLGLTEGLEMIVREEQGRYIVEPLDAPRKKIDLTGISGLYPQLQPLPRDEFDDPPRVWQSHSSSAPDGR